MASSAKATVENVSIPKFDTRASLVFLRLTRSARLFVTLDMYRLSADTSTAQDKIENQGV